MAKQEIWKKKKKDGAESVTINFHQTCDFYT